MQAGVILHLERLHDVPEMVLGKLFQLQFSSGTGQLESAWLVSVICFAKCAHVVGPVLGAWGSPDVLRVNHQIPSIT